MSGSATASFLYDGDGVRVKGTVGGVTTYYPNQYYEVAGGVVKKYYYAGPNRVAMTDDLVSRTLLGDHLGSTAVTVAGSTELGEVRYRAFGATRFTSGTTPTTFRYTGQREESSLGLYYYGARWYDPGLGRFVQADTVVPNAADARAYDRYAYALNSPLRYIDPTGHAAQCQPDCSPQSILDECQGSTTCVWTQGGQWLLDHADYDPRADPNYGQQTDYSLILLMVAQINLDNGNQTQAEQYLLMLNEGVAPQVAGDTIGVVSYVGAAGVAAAVRYVNPATLRWTQRTAGGRGRAADLRQSLTEKGWAGDPIDVVDTSDGLVTVDHTRAAIALELDMDSIPVRVHSPSELLPQDMVGRFRSPGGKVASTWGEAITYRAAGQAPPLPPTGTSRPPRLPPK